MRIGGGLPLEKWITGGIAASRCIVPPVSSDCLNREWQVAHRDWNGPAQRRSGSPRLSAGERDRGQFLLPYHPIAAIIPTMLNEHHRLFAVIAAFIQFLAALLDYWAGGE